MIKKLLYYLQLFDWVWSVPLAFLGFILFPILGEVVFGEGFAFYPPDFFHAGIYAALIVIFFNGLSFLAIYFNFRGLHKYYLTQSKEDFVTLKPWQKICLFLFLYVFFSLELLAVFTLIV